MGGIEVGVSVVEGFEAFKFVSDAFDLETALVPGVEDAACATFPDCVAKVSLSPKGAGGLVVRWLELGLGLG